MIVINESACSHQFKAAFKALEEGRAVRRTSWPDGQELFKRTDGCIAVRRSGSSITPTWAGPRGEESEATDWVIE